MTTILATFAFLLAVVWALAERDARKAREAELRATNARLEWLAGLMRRSVEKYGDPADKQQQREVLPFPSRRAKS